MLTCVKAFMKICLCFILELDFDLEYTFFGLFFFMLVLYRTQVVLDHSWRRERPFFLE